ncbi:MAG TPA: polymer-forming cytoskeletal protein [Vicinamibacteria bacterium]|nr:polymer-forming cytoskeletal protein [Vicinamibacteria bacterium]
MKRKGEPGGDLSGFLDKGTEFHGDVIFQDTLTIYGKFEGTIRSVGLLVVGESAEVNAQIEVARISVSGRLKGSVRATERVELHEPARCECSFDTKVLVVSEGAQFDGQCTMEGSRSAPRDVASDKVKRFAPSE